MGNISVLLERGRAGQVFTRPGHEYTRNLVDSLPVPDPTAQRLRRLAAATENGRSQTVGPERAS